MLLVAGWKFGVWEGKKQPIDEWVPHGESILDVAIMKKTFSKFAHRLCLGISNIFCKKGTILKTRTFFELSATFSICEHFFKNRNNFKNTPQLWAFFLKHKKIMKFSRTFFKFVNKLWNSKQIWNRKHFLNFWTKIWKMEHFTKF